MAQASSHPSRVALIVEDEALVRLYAADLLEEEGFQVLEAASADEALALLERRNDVRLLFTDVNMPGSLDGLALAREVHARWPNVQLLVASGRLRLGSDELPDDGRFVAKPYRPEQLIAEIRDLVGKRPHSAAP